MNKHTSRIKTGLLLTGVVIALLLASLAILPSCTNTLKGEQTANQKPIVQFVNIPPAGQRFSHNPEVYWVGNDRDGQISYYRYFVAVVDSAGGTNDSAMAFIHALNDTMWTYVDIDPTVPDPHTANIIPLTANLKNPVNDYVPQYVFLQAFDNEGAGSDIVYRVLNRNDNPPETNISYFDPRAPFVNAVFPGGIVTGLRLTWGGSDRKDYDELGLTAPPFQFEWKLFGPYKFTELDNPDSTWKSALVRVVFVTEDARIFDIGDTLYRCDTTLVDTGGGSVIEESCDTTVFSLIQRPNTNFYVRDSILNVDDTLFTNRLVDQSSNGVDSWVMDTGDTLYNVYKNYQSDTTLTLRFIFWIRCRDDALVSDLTPEFRQAIVINPRYEREVCVIDLTPKVPSPRNYNSPVNYNVAKAFWYNTINAWLQHNPNTAGKVFDTTTIPDALHPSLISSQDYIMAKEFSALTAVPLQTFLKHKVVVLYNENANQIADVVQGSSIHFPQVFTAIDAGVNTWATWRCPYVGVGSEAGVYPAPFQFTHYFGVVGYGWSKWFLKIIDPTSPFRVEDFTGAYSIDPTKWPDIAVDTSLLHSRLLWTIAPWRDSIAALPEVDWAERAFGTEVMYLYKSKYGPSHPLGGVYNLEGSPCGHRFKTSLFRTVHLNFTPLVLKEPEVQELADSVLDWLYDPNLGGHGKAVVTENRYPDAPVKISIQEARDLYNQRVQEEAAEAKAQGVTH